MNVSDGRGSTPVLLPQIGFTDGSPLQSVSVHPSSVDTHRVMTMLDPRHRKEYIPLRRPEVPMAENGYNVVVLTGGKQSYHHSGSRSQRHAPWHDRLTSGMRDCYVIWGRSTQGGQIFPTSRPVRTAGGYGAFYTKRPVFTDTGAVEGYCTELRVVRFRIVDKESSKGDCLLLELVDHVKSMDGNVMPYRATPFTERLVNAARAGFNRECHVGLEPDVNAWWAWFRRQKRLRDQASRYNDDYVWRGWFAELDKVTEAWQLEAVLNRYRHMFPERGPRESEDFLRDALRRNPHARQLAIPEYAGTDSSRDSLLLQAYYATRPARAETFEKWIADFINLNSRIRNYTGD